MAIASRTGLRRRLSPTARHLAWLTVYYVAMALAIGQVERVLGSTTAAPSPLTTVTRTGFTVGASSATAPLGASEPRARAFLRPVSAMIGAMLLALPVAWVDPSRAGRRASRNPSSTRSSCCRSRLPGSWCSYRTASRSPSASPASPPCASETRSTIPRTRSTCSSPRALALPRQSVSSTSACPRLLRRGRHSLVDRCRPHAKSAQGATDVGAIAPDGRAAHPLAGGRPAIRSLQHRAARVFRECRTNPAPDRGDHAGSGEAMELTGVTPGENGYSVLDYVVRLRARTVLLGAPE